MSAYINRYKDNEILNKMKDETDINYFKPVAKIIRSFSEPSPNITTNSNDLKHKALKRTETSGNYNDFH